MNRQVSLKIVDKQDSFIVQERLKSRHPRQIAEASLCFIAAFLIFCAYFQILFPLINLGAGGFSMPLVFSVSAIAIGLGLYAFGTRGYLPELGVDKRSRRIWICKLNSKGRTRMKRWYSKEDTKSLFVLRPTDGSPDAALFLRLKGNALPIRLVRGQLDDVEAAHRKLCEIFRAEDPISAANFVGRKSPGHLTATDHEQIALA
jgi:hypothetical protein